MDEWGNERRQLLTDTLGGGEHGHRKRFDTTDRANWDAMCDRLHEKLGRYRTIIQTGPAEAR
jgi:hypothetical protein